MTKGLSAVRWTIVLLFLLVCPLLVLSFTPSHDGHDHGQRGLNLSPATESGLSGGAPCFVDDTAAEEGYLQLYYSDINEYWKDEYLLSHLRKPECRHLLSSTHKLTVSGYGSLANMSCIASTLPLFSRLDSLHWKNTDPIPGTILSAMRENHPDYRLHYELPLYKWDLYDGRGSARSLNHPDTNNDAVRREAKRNILHDKNLHTLEASIRYADGDGESMPLIHKIITTCPNLRKLDLSVGYYGGCTPGWPHIYAFDFTDKKFAGTSFPPLEVLRLSGYDFDKPLKGTTTDWTLGIPDWHRERLKDPWQWLLSDTVISGLQPCAEPWLRWMCKNYTQPAWQPTGCPSNFSGTSNIDGWLKHMDFSDLQSLELRSPSSGTLHKISPVLINLTSLTIHGGDVCAGSALNTLLTNTSNPLSTLKLYNIRFSSLEPVMQALVTILNGTLTTFSLHEHDELREHSCYYYGPEDSGSIHCRNDTGSTWWNPRLYLNNTQLRRLAASSPSIETLELDLDRNQTQSSMDEIFSTLSLFPHLRKLILHIESPSIESIRNGSRHRYSPPRERYDSAGYHDPLVNATWVEETFRKVRSQQRDKVVFLQQGSEKSVALQEMEVYVGRWETRDENSMTGPTPVVIGRFVCDLGPGSGRGRGRERCEGGVQLPND